MTLYVINTPVITSVGKYEVKKISKQQAITLLKKHRKFQSAVGHESTAKFLTALLGIKIPFRRVMISMRKGDKAIVLRLKTRLPEGKVLTEKELKNISYELWLMEKK